MLTMEPVVQVNISVNTNTVSSGVFDVGAILGPSSVLSVTNRFKKYVSTDEMIEDGFTAESPEYLAAVKYFQNSPAPAAVVVIYYSTASGSDETPASALADAVTKGAEFYGLYYCPAEDAEAAAIKTNIVALVSYLDSQKKGILFYGVTGEVDAVIDSGALFASLSNAQPATRRALGLYCAEDVDDAAALMGTAMGLARQYADGSFALCYKGVPAAVAASITEAEADSIKAVNGNVYVQRTRNSSGVEFGATASGMRFDEVLYLDRIASDLQTALYDLIHNTTAKLPQTDDTTTLLINECSRILERYYGAGVLATAVWRGANIMSVVTGDTIEHGYTCMADSFDTQSDEDRYAHKAMPITILLCLSGAIESVVLNVFVQR